MDRRTFTQTLAGTVAGIYGLTHTPDLLSASAAGTSNSPEPFNLSVMLWTVFRDLPFEQRLEKVAEAGYRNVELVGEYSKWTDDDFKRANAKRKELGITFDSTAGLKRWPADPEQRSEFLTELHNALTTMERIECPSMIILSGNRIPGLTREVQHQSCIDTLKAAAELVEGKSINGKPINLLLETIDPEENPQYFLTEVAEALQVVQSVNHPQVKLLYDFFHEQISAGNLIAKLEKAMPYLALVHIADVPGRHEPGTGEINYENIYRKLAELNYQGMIAMEFRPTGDVVAQLRTAREAAQKVGRETIGKKPAA